jgi:hypothetical protein
LHRTQVNPPPRSSQPFVCFFLYLVPS